MQHRPSFHPSSSSSLLTASKPVLIHASIDPFPGQAPSSHRASGFPAEDTRIVQTKPRRQTSQVVPYAPLQKSRGSTLHTSGRAPRRPEPCLWEGRLLYIGSITSSFRSKSAALHSLASCLRTLPPRQPCSRRCALGYHPVKSSSFQIPLLLAAVAA